MISMDNVAEKAGVSKATVSRVLSGKSIVSEEVRKKVLTACKELNYKLNHNIQDLILKSRNGATRNIAFVLVGIDFADPAYARLVDGISAAINKYHYHLMLVKMSGQEKSIYDLPPVLRDMRVDGILISGSITPESVELIKTLEIQSVVIGNYSEHLLGPLSSVQAKLGLIVYDLIEKLVQAGKKRIAFVEEAPENYSSNLIFEGYRQALKAFSLPFDKSICYFGRGVLTGMFETLKPVFRKKELPFDSIFCPDMRIAREVSHLIIGHFGLEREITVPVAAIRQSSYHTLSVPAVYTDLNVEKRVEAAFTQLVDQIEGRKNPQTIMIK